MACGSTEEWLKLKIKYHEKLKGQKITEIVNLVRYLERYLEEVSSKIK